MSAPYAIQAASLSTKGQWEQNRPVREALDAGNRGAFVKPGEDFFSFYNHDIIMCRAVATVFSACRR